LRYSGKTRGNVDGCRRSYAARAANDVSPAVPRRAQDAPVWRVAVVAAVATLCALCVLGCGTWSELPPSQVPRLLAARTDEIKLIDAEGDPITISRSDVQEVELVAREGWNLLAPGRGSGLPPWQIVAVPEAQVGRAEEQGWRFLRTFHDPIAMRLEGEFLLVQDDQRGVTVPVRELKQLRVKQFSSGRTALLVAIPIASVLVVGLIVNAYCQEGRCAPVSGN
jgi:hypothetical protein